MPSLWLFELPAIVLGLLLGSFLNVCIARLPLKRSVVKPRSRCERCGQTIRWYDNVPVVSWLLLRGRCRDCGAAISWRYPAVELAVAVWFGFLALSLFHNLYTVSGVAAANAPRLMVERAGEAVFGFLLLGLMVMDWRTQRLPDAFTLWGVVIGFVLTCAQALYLNPGEGDIHFNPQNQLRMNSPGSFQIKGDVFMTGPEALVLGRLAAIVGALSVMLAIRGLYRKLRHREGMGLGDAKLMAMLAAFLGFWPSLLCLLVGSVLGSLYSVPLLLGGRAKGATRVPFGVFLCAAGFLVALFGGPVAEWYLGLLR